MFFEGHDGVRKLNERGVKNMVEWERSGGYRKRHEW